MRIPSPRRPTTGAISGFLTAQSVLDFSYPEVGATAAVPPPGYALDRTRVALGDGERVFSKAKDALRRWDQFRLGWVEALPRETPIVTGAVVGVVARLGGLWWLNACRIVYVVDERAAVERFGFAYGTLPGHAETGEERFLVEWERETGAVWYDILAFSRPRHVLARLVYPYTRRVQKRFGRESAGAMVRAVR